MGVFQIYPETNSNLKMKFPFGILPYFQGICLSFGEGLYLSFREGLQKGGGRLTQFCGSFRNYRVLKGPGVSKGRG